MTWLAVAPVMAAFLASLAAWPCSVRLPPNWATRLMTVLLAMIAGATASALALVVVASLSHLEVVQPLLGWCRDLYSHGAPAWSGALAALVLVVGSVRVARWRREWRRTIDAWSGAHQVEVVRGAGPVAFAVPGQPGTVVVGEDLLLALEPPERAVVFAHEEAHLALHHHRYLAVRGFCVAAFAFLAPLGARVEFLTERWADEHAAQTVGDRGLVARAISRAALFSHSMQPGPLPALVGATNTHRRVAALLSEPVDGGRSITPAALASAGIVTFTLGGSSLQLHHLWEFIAHVCPT